MDKHEIEPIEFTQVEFSEGKFRLHNIVYDSPRGETSGVFITSTELLVCADNTLWRSNGTDYTELCSLPHHQDCALFSDESRLYVWKGNLYTCIQNERTTAKCVEDYFQKRFGPWYFNNGMWRHAITGKRLFGGYDVEYATYATLETVQVNNAIISEAILKLTGELDRRRIVEICREYIKTDDHKAAINSFKNIFLFP